MKRLWALIIFIICGGVVFANDEFSPITLEDDSDYISKPILNSELSSEKIFKMSITKPESTSGSEVKFLQSTNMYEAKQKSFVRQKEFDDFTLGIKTDTTIQTDSYKGVNTFFTKYNRDAFSVNTSYSSDSSAAFQKRVNGKLSFSPEYRFNKIFTLKTAHTSDLLNKSQKNELILNFKPLKEDRLNLDVGLGQVHSQVDKRSRPQLNFSTNIKF